MALITPYWGLDGILILSSLLIAAYLYATRKFRYWANKGVVEIPPIPFLGNFKDCLLNKMSPAYYVKNLYDQAKGLPYIGFYIFDKPILVVRDPELVKHVLVKDFNVFSNRYACPDPVNDRLGYANVLMMKNPDWKVLRTKLTPIFTSGKLKRMYELMLAIADDLDQHLEKQNLENGKVIEVKELSANFTTDLIATTAFGVRANSLQDKDAPFRYFGRKIFDHKFTRAIEALTIFFIPGLTKYIRAKFFGKESSKFLRSVFWQVINERVASGVKRGDLIDILIELKENHGNHEKFENFDFNGDDLVAQAAIFFSGGFETSSAAMAFALYELAMNLDVQKTLRQEIQKAREETGGKITYDTIMTLPYLDMVISETVRKYPPLGFIDRVAGSDYKFPDTDITIEKGTPVYISITGFHHDPEYFPNPDKYDPMRFSDEVKKARPNFTYFPFGEGPHACIGLRLGLMQSKLGVAQVISKYEVTPCEETPARIVLNPKAIITTALEGIYLNIRKINTEAA